MLKSGKKDWIDFADKKLTNLEQRIEELEKLTQQMNKFMSEDIETYSSLVLDCFGVFLGKEAKLALFDKYIETIKAREKELENVKKGLIYLPSSDLVESIILLAAQGKIPFEKLSPYLIEKLGKKLAKKLVKKEAMLEMYGKEGLKIWETLVGK